MSQTFSRRDVLKLLGAAPVAAATVGGASRPAVRRGPGPKLFFSAEDVPRLRKRWAEDPRFASLREGLLNRDRAAIREHLGSDIDFRDPLRAQREIAEWGQELAFVCLMEDDADAGRLAIECIRTTLKFPHWDFFRDGPEKVVGVQRAPDMAAFIPCVIDWVGDLLDHEECQHWLWEMGAKGCEPCYTGLHNVMYPREALGWRFNIDTTPGELRAKFPNEMSRRPEITQNTNLRAHPASGLAIGAVVVACYGDDTSQVERWLDMAVTNLEAMKDAYEPDGSYGEGVSYGDYTSRTIIMGLEALRHSGLRPTEVDIDWRGNMAFMLNMAMPTADYAYNVVNIGDNGRYHHQRHDSHRTGRPEMRTAAAYWVARHFRDGRAQWFGETLGGLESMWSLIYRDDTVVPTPPPPGPRSWRPDLDWMVARTGYETDDLVVSLRSGRGFNHEHADRNSIIVKGYGEALIVDPLRPPYNYEDASWMLRLTHGHSAVLIGGEGHFYNNGVEGTNATIAQARIVAEESSKHHATWVSDATQAYRIVNADVRSVVRAVVVCFDLAAVVVVDRVTMWKQAAVVESRFFADNHDGQAKLTATDDGFRIARPLAWSNAAVFGRETLEVEATQLPIAPDRAEKNPYVGVRTAPTKSTTLVTAIGLAPTGGRPAAATISAGDETITVLLRGAGRTVRCHIHDAPEVPSVKVEV